MKLFLLKDTPQEVQFLCDMIAEEFPNFEIVGAANNLLTAKGMIEALKPELLFFDADMQDGHHIIDLLKESKEQEMPGFDVILAVSDNHHNHLAQSMKDSAIACLTKPLDRDKLRVAFWDALANYHKRNKTLDYIGMLLNQVVGVNGAAHTIAVPLAKGVIEIIQPDEIAWLESKTVYTDIHLRDGRMLHAMRNIGYFRDALIPHLPFFQISQQAIIHLQFMRRFVPNENQVILRNGHSIHVSRKYGRQLRQYLQDTGRESMPAKLFRLFKYYL